jgi:hypothetical protein
MSWLQTQDVGNRLREGESYFCCVGIILYTESTVPASLRNRNKLFLHASSQMDLTHLSLSDVSSQSPPKYVLNDKNYWFSFDNNLLVVWSSYM